MSDDTEHRMLARLNTAEREAAEMENHLAKAYNDNYNLRAALQLCVDMIEDNGLQEALKFTLAKAKEALGTPVVRADEGLIRDAMVSQPNPSED